MRLRIFFSWQMTTKTKYNKNFILDSIDKALKTLKNKTELNGVEFVVLEGVTGEPGTVQVAHTIASERIPTCDIFIADLSVINQTNLAAKFAGRIFGNKFKPIQNNNVLYEYGVAYNSLGERKIISVLNKDYGSPNENPDNIPFDLKHLRFPIEYSYSKRNGDKAKASKEFIGVLTSAIKETAQYAIKTRKDKHKPLVEWSEWNRLSRIKGKFRSNETIEKLENQINKAILTPQESVRIIGLSGLGKTRILLEIFRPKEGDHDSEVLSSRVLYMNCSYQDDVDYESIFSKLKEEGENRVVILDNCEKNLHRQLLRHIDNEQNSIFLITLNSNPEEIDQDKLTGVNYFTLKKDDLASVVQDILEEDFEFLDEENVKRITEFSQGIPLMAVLLGESVRDGEKFVGRLSDKELLDKLLGEKGKDTKSRKYLKSCSIFNYFGFEGKVKTQSEFIATDTSITPITDDDDVKKTEFYETCSHFLKREVFEKKGRYLSMRPLPLAMSLAQEWLEPCTPDRFLQVIKNISVLEEPDRSKLSQSLAEQMKYLAYDLKAVAIVDNILGEGSSFRNAEVLNTEIGSRLFRSFVEVNPEASVNCLIQVFGNLTIDQLKEIDKGRRNLVWALEKLCFRKETFERSAIILLAFAAGENETWGNNATNQFLQVFHIHLAGTEADLTLRENVIEYALSKKEKIFIDLGISAINSGLKAHGFVRMNGAEKQGGASALIDFVPNNGQIYSYWQNLINKLEPLLYQDEIQVAARKILVNSIFNLSTFGAVKIVLPIIESLAEKEGKLSIDILDVLKRVINFERSFLMKEEKERFEFFIQEYEPKDVDSRYFKIVARPNWDDLKNSKLGYTQQARLNTEQFALEFLLAEDVLSHIPMFYEKEQQEGYYFGASLANNIQDDSGKDSFIKASIDYIRKSPLEEINPIVFNGFLSGCPESLVEKTLDNLESNEADHNLYFIVMRSIKFSDCRLDRVFTIIEKDNDYSILELKNLRFSVAIDYMNPVEVLKFTNRLLDFNVDGAWVALLIIEAYCHSNEERWEQCKDQIEGILRTNDFLHYLLINDNSNLYTWESMTLKVLEDKGTNFAKKIANELVSICCSPELGYGGYGIELYMRRIISNLLEDYFDVVWDDFFGKGLLSDGEAYLTYYNFRQLLSNNFGFEEGILFKSGKNNNKILDWAKKNKPEAARRLAQFMPTLNVQNEYEWHPFAKAIIDQYGDDKEILDALSSNLGTYSWSGTTIPLYKGQIQAFKILLNHKFPLVRAWASSQIKYLEYRITDETTREQERFL